MLHRTGGASYDRDLDELEDAAAMGAAPSRGSGKKKRPSGRSSDADKRLSERTNSASPLFGGGGGGGEGGGHPTSLNRVSSSSEIVFMGDDMLLPPPNIGSLEGGGDFAPSQRMSELQKKQAERQKTRAQHRANKHKESDFLNADTPPSSPPKGPAGLGVDTSDELSYPGGEETPTVSNMHHAAPHSGFSSRSPAATFPPPLPPPSAPTVDLPTSFPPALRKTLLDRFDSCGSGGKKLKLILESLQLTAKTVPVAAILDRFQSNLHKLSLSNNALRGPPAPLISELYNLQTLNLSQCEIVSVEAEWDLPSLRR